MPYIATSLPFCSSWHMLLNCREKQTKKNVRVYSNLGGSSLAHKILHLIQGFLTCSYIAASDESAEIPAVLQSRSLEHWTKGLHMSMATDWIVRSWANNNCIPVCLACKWLIIKGLVLCLQDFFLFGEGQCIIIILMTTTLTLQNELCYPSQCWQIQQQYRCDYNILLQNGLTKKI